MARQWMAMVGRMHLISQSLKMQVLGEGKMDYSCCYVWPLTCVVAITSLLHHITANQQWTTVCGGGAGCEHVCRPPMARWAPLAMPSSRPPFARRSSSGRMPPCRHSWLLLAQELWELPKLYQMLAPATMW